MQTDFSARAGAALLVGATGGIGTAIARLLRGRGSSVALAYRANTAAAEALALELSDSPGLSEPDGRARPAPPPTTARRRSHAWRLELTDAAACARVLAEVATTFGGVHTVIYAAGPQVPMVHLSRATPAQFRTQIEQDAVGFFNLVSPALPYLRETSGSLVAVTTAATSRYPVRDGLSAGPKGAVEALVRGIAAEEGRFGVRANCVGPGMLTDGMAARLIAAGDLDPAALAVARANIPLRRFGGADDIAEAVCFLASDRAGYITGQKLDVDGGYSV